MARYNYQGLDENGRRIKGAIEALDRGQAIEELRRKGRFVTRIWLQPMVGINWNNRLKTGELEPFCRQLSLLLESGISLLESLELIKKEHLPRTLEKWLEQLVGHIRKGQSLAAAMAQCDAKTPPMLLELAAVGEEHGQLGAALQQAADHLESQRQLKNDLVTAMLYPALVLLVVLAAVAAMMVFVVPALVQTYASLNAPIPWLTRGFIALSDAVVQYGMGLLLAALFLTAGGMVTARRLRENSRWQALWRRVVQSTALTERLWAEHYYVQFAQMLGQLLEGGVQVLEALQMQKRHYHGLVYRSELERLTDEALRGHSLSNGLAGCTFVPPAALQMIHAGEESGHLAEMLLHSSAYYSQRIRQRCQRLARIIEPVLIIFLGLLILLIAGSLFLPIISSYRYIG